MKGLLYPPNVQWEVTSKCNHNCIHCYNCWRGSGENVRDTDNYLGIARQLIKRHPVSVAITGGEPLMVFDSIKEAILLLRGEGIAISVNTNATLVTDKIAKLLAENKISVLASLPCYRSDICDQVTRVKGSYENIISGIKTLVANGVVVTVNMVVSRQNMAYLYDTAKFVAEDLEIDRFTISRVSKPVKPDPDFHDMLLLGQYQMDVICHDLLKIEEDFGLHVNLSTPVPACTFMKKDTFNAFAYEHKCTAGKTSYAIDCLGNVKACPRDPVSYGNILEENFDKIWGKMSAWRDETYLPEDCKNCESRQKCGGGCRLDAFSTKGKKNLPDPLADVFNVPIRYEKEHTNIMFGEDYEFSVREDMRMLRENGGWRLSVGRNYYLAREELKIFLSANATFLLSQFMHHFRVDYELANNEINMLVRKNLIEITDFADNEHEDCDEETDSDEECYV